MFKKLVAKLKPKPISIEKERAMYNEKFHSSYGFRVNDDKKIDVIKDIYLFLKKDKRLESFIFVGKAHHNNQGCPLEVYSQILSSLKKLDPSVHNYFLKYGFYGLLDISKKNNYITFNSNLLKVEKLYALASKLPLNEKQKVNEFVKYLIRTEKINSFSNKQLEREVERIKAGLLQTKITSSKKRKSCDETYGGFLRALSSNSAYFITIENKLYLVKSHIGKKEDYAGYSKLALDLSNLNVYSIETINGKNIVSEKALEFFYQYKTSINLSVTSYFERLKDNYIKYYQNKFFKTEVQRQKAIQRIQDIFNKDRISKISKK